MGLYCGKYSILSSIITNVLTLQFKLSGKLAPVSRDQNIAKFRDDKEIQVMISSLKTGGVGLDLSVANKCILIDLWWNEAIQEQVSAFLQKVHRPAS